MGFSPKTARFSLYFATGDTDRDKLLSKLGKHKSGAACVYVNKLADVDLEVLKALIEQSVTFLQEKYPSNN
ncbi:protein of unknown function (DU1801) [Oceanobacillus limi]|uniref:YdhG-like domain-containing protein n=1 Tax=Oceanobacillus limi TaxID=930131 RepID=A0A1I0C5U3_9BACI|nr:protein of unknown function (DU1801) [Oceanobacillus limi]